MAGTFKDIGSGAVGGAVTGAAFGPWGALAGGALGGIMGAFTDEPPTADELGIKPIDAREMAQEFMPSEEEMQTQRNDFATRADQSTERSAENMIASGMDPARAHAIASRNMGSSLVRNETNQNAQRMTMIDELSRQFMPQQTQREEDILNYNMSIKDQPGILESFIPMATDMWLSQGLGGIKDAWGGNGLGKVGDVAEMVDVNNQYLPAEFRNEIDFSFGDRNSGPGLDNSPFMSGLSTADAQQMRSFNPLSQPSPYVDNRSIGERDPRRSGMFNEFLK